MRYDAVAFLEALFAPGGGLRTAVSPGSLPAEWREDWEERTAVIEYDGGLPRNRAEQLALLEVVRRMRGA